MSLATQHYHYNHYHHYKINTQTTVVKEVLRPQRDCQEVCGEWLAAMLEQPKHIHTSNVVFKSSNEKVRVHNILDGIINRASTVPDLSFHINTS